MKTAATKNLIKIHPKQKQRMIYVRQIHFQFLLPWLTLCDNGMNDTIDARIAMLATMACACAKRKTFTP